MYDFVAIGNITVDFFYKGKDLTHDNERFHLAYGGKYYAGEFHQSLGGSAANATINASSLGANAAVVATVGETAFKNVIMQHLVKRNVSTEFLEFERAFMSVSTILLGEDGERTVIMYNDPRDSMRISQTALERMKRSGMIFMGNLSDVPLAERIKIISSVSTPENIVAVNIGSRDCELKFAKMEPYLKHANILILNRFEFCELMDVNPESIHLGENQKERIPFELDVLVITDGKGGSYAYTSTEVFQHEASGVKQIVDATGAGDAFTAGFLVQYKRTKNIPQALQLGTETAGKILKKVGAN